MKHKVSELKGALLDAAVAMAEGRKPEIVPYRVNGGLGITFVRDEPVCTVGVEHFEPSTRWGHGGPIIEQERLEILSSLPGIWEAGPPGSLEPSGASVSFCGRGQRGSTPLIAAMRAFVASKLGAEIDLPE